MVVHGAEKWHEVSMFGLRLRVNQGGECWWVLKEEGKLMEKGKENMLMMTLLSSGNSFRWKSVHIICLMLMKTLLNR